MKLGLYCTTVLLSGAAYILALFASREFAEMIPVAPGTDPETEGAVLFLFLALFAGATAFMLFLFRLYRAPWLYRTLFSLVAFLGLFKLFETVFPFEFSAVVSAIFLAGFFLIPTIWTHDIIVILASAGIASVFALSFSEATAITLLLVLSVYDVIAVFVTKHMVTLAHAMIKSKATFAFFVPERFRGFGESIAAVRPGAGFLILGGGDIVLPAIYLCAIARENPSIAVAGMSGALVGQFLNHLIMIQLRKPLPALPAIALGAIAGVAVGRGVFSL